MDRNITLTRMLIGCVVALRKESVDRNSGLMSVVRFATSSLSARRAWIEMEEITAMNIDVTVALRKESVDRNIIYLLTASALLIVALRKESVDRNNGTHYDNYNLHWSLSARRAWIEITLTVRNVPIDSRRSPQGERG